MKSCKILAKVVTFPSHHSPFHKAVCFGFVQGLKLGPLNVCIPVTAHKSGENPSMKPDLSWFCVYKAMLFSLSMMCKPVMSTWNFRKAFAHAKGRAYHKTRKRQLPPLEQQTILKSQLQMCPEV